jgi:hypothetical protein
MRKLTSLVIGLVTAISTVTISQAAIMPNHSILEATNSKLRVQVFTPNKKLVVPKTTAIKKIPN